MLTTNLWKTVFVCAAAAITLPAAPTLTTLVNFTGSNGVFPLYYGSLIQGSDGNLFGITYEGGVNNDGTVFSMTPAGSLTTLYSFCSKPSCADGENPAGGLIQGTSGDLYGTTAYGGASANCNSGCGAIFQITTTGTLTVLHSFEGTDGQNPMGTLVQGTNGDFYGTTYAGGTFSEGTVFQITSTGTFHSLFSFGGSNGSYPYAGLVEVSGKFYGATSQGANSNCSGGCGTIFSITTTKALTTLHQFDGYDGAYPYGALVLAKNGDLYGTTYQGGGCFDSSAGCGTVFQISPAGTGFTALHNFDGDGAYPTGTLVQASNGNFYGTTYAGGVSKTCSGGCGTIFTIAGTGSVTALKSLYSFCLASGCPDGETIYGGLVEGTSDLLYGITWQGGSAGAGTAFSLNVGL